MPVLTNVKEDGDVEKAGQAGVRLLTIQIWLLGLIVVGFLAFNDDFLTIWVGEEFYAGPLINGLLIGGVILRCFLKILSNYCYALGDIKRNSLVEFVQNLLILVCFIIGGRYYGLLGIAVGPLVGMFLTGIWYYPRSFSRLLQLGRGTFRILFREFAAILASGSVLVWAFSYWRASSWLEFFVAVALFTLLCGGFLAILSRPFRVECRHAFQLFKRLAGARFGRGT
jgi:O-antigen/teichoic acid export membrane protein